MRSIIAKNEHLTENVISERRGKNNVKKFANEVAFARNYLVYAGYLDKSVRGLWKLTDDGWNVDMTDELASLKFKQGLSKLNDKRNVKADCRWVDFYMELASALLKFKNNRNELINILKTIFSDAGMNFPFKERGKEVYEDICPFTVFGCFNKGITNANRIALLEQFAKQFSIKAAVPTEFDGIPVVMNLSAWFFAYKENRGEHDIDNLWDLLEKAIAYSDEASTLGKPTLLRWYAVVLIQWMEGTDLSNIMKKALEYRQQHRDNFWVNRGQKEYYDDGLRHRNIVFADTLEVIDNIVLFSISNYFLRFSNEYKTVHQLKEFDNNWYEFVEYGTTNPITILLQRNGFSREVSTYIRNNKDEFIIEGPDGKWHLSTALLECSNTNARTEASSVRYNMPELFAEKI